MDLGSSVVILGGFGVLLVWIWGFLGSLWVRFGAFWGHFGVDLGLFRAIWGGIWDSGGKHPPNWEMKPNMGGK